VRPVNLLPDKYRARQAVKPAGHTSLFVLGGLAGLLVAVVLPVMAQNSIDSRQSQIAAAKQEQQAEQQRAATLGPFGTFAEVKQQRLDAVNTAAKGRFDWERLMRELSVVLPNGTWITAAKASASGAADDAAAPGAPPADGAVPGAPTLSLSACAPSQSAVAASMVRLRSLHRALDVELMSSTGQDAGSGAGTGTGCGASFQFETTVSFSQTLTGSEGERGDRVPTRLGGGS